MDIIIQFSIQDGIILILLGLVFFLVKKINTLKAEVSAERKKRTLPLLTLEVDTDNIAFILHNKSDAHARDIQFDHIYVTLDSGFTKTFSLVFEPIEMINPNEKTVISYKVFDKQLEYDPKTAKSLFMQLAYSTFEVLVRYKNLENAQFVSKLLKKKDNVTIIEVRPLENPSDQKNAN